MVALGKTYLVRVMMLSSTVSENSTFQNYSHIKHLKTKLTLLFSRSGSTMEHHLIKFDRTHFQNVTYQGPVIGLLVPEAEVRRVEP